MSCKTSRNFGKDLEVTRCQEDGAELAAVIREIMYEGDKCTGLFDVQQLLKGALGDCKAGRSGMLVFGNREHRVGVIVVSGLGKCYNRTQKCIQQKDKRE